MYSMYRATPITHRVKIGINRKIPKYRCIPGFLFEKLFLQQRNQCEGSNGDTNHQARNGKTISTLTGFLDLAKGDGKGHFPAHEGFHLCAGKLRGIYQLSLFFASVLNSGLV